MATVNIFGDIFEISEEGKFTTGQIWQLVNGNNEIIVCLPSSHLKKEEIEAYLTSAGLDRSTFHIASSKRYNTIFIYTKQIEYDQVKDVISKF